MTIASHLLTSAVMVAIMTPADYLTGRDWKWTGWPTRSIYATAPVVMLALAAWSQWGLHTPSMDWRWSLLGLGWACWRSVLGWSSFGGSMDPQTPGQTWAELERNAVSALFPLAALVTFGAKPWAAVVLMGLFAVWATGVAYWFGLEVKKGHDVDPIVDALHGFGMALLMSAAV